MPDGRAKPLVQPHLMEPAPELFQANRRPLGPPRFVPRQFLPWNEDRLEAGAQPYALPYEPNTLPPRAGHFYGDQHRLRPRLPPGDDILNLPLDPYRFGTAAPASPAPPAPRPLPWDVWGRMTGPAPPPSALAPQNRPPLAFNQPDEFNVTPLTRALRALRLI